MKVFLVESGDYEQRGVDCIAESPEAAVAYIKGRYTDPHYIVEWEWNENEMCLRGAFRAVAQWSTEHVARYDVTEYEVVRVSAEESAPE